MSDRPTPTRRYLGFLLLLFTIGLGMVGIGYLPTRSLGGADAVRGMLFGCALSFIGSIVGSLPVLAASARPSGSRPADLLASFGLRFFVVVAGAAALALSGVARPRPFLIWVAISYPLFLVADVRYSLEQQKS